MNWPWFVVYCVLSVVCLSPGSVDTAYGWGEMTEFKVLEGSEDKQCASTGERESARNELHQITDSAILATTAPRYTCNGTPGWRRVAFINMTDASYNCPTGLNLTSYSKRTCGRSHTGLYGCSSTTFNVGGLLYSRVCGRIRGYQFGGTSAFFYYTRGIDSYYVGGVSLTHGAAGSRQHIWTFAAGLTEVSSSFRNYRCPCDTGSYDRVPAFVGNDYFCESGLHSPWSSDYYVLFADDVLWDGQKCESSSTCCELNNPPWFTKNLPTPSTGDIELRLCAIGSPDFEDVPIEIIELYVQ